MAALAKTFAMDFLEISLLLKFQNTKSAQANFPEQGTSFPYTLSHTNKLNYPFFHSNTDSFSKIHFSQQQVTYFHPTTSCINVIDY